MFGSSTKGPGSFSNVNQTYLPVTQLITIDLGESRFTTLALDPPSGMSAGVLQYISQSSLVGESSHPLSLMFLNDPILKPSGKAGRFS